MLRLMRGSGVDGQVSPAARLVAALVVLGMFAMAAPTLAQVLGWFARLL